MSDKQIHMMVDIETLGTKPGCEIIEIGAVIFDSASVSQEFHIQIDVSESLCGLYVDLPTIEWHAKHTESLKKLSEGKSREYAAQAFISWANSAIKQKGTVWANSPAFDCKILNYWLWAVLREGEDFLPFRQHRDFRTIKNIFGTEYPNLSDILTSSHKALQDAKDQALYLIELNKLIQADHKLSIL